MQAGVNVVIIGSKDGKAGVSVDEFLGAATDEFLCIRTPVEGAAGYPATPRGFGTGSFGWSSSARIVVAGMSCQMGLNLIVLGSKPA